MRRQRGVVYDTGRSLGSLSMNWRPDYSQPLMRRELDIIRADLHANAVRLGGRDPRRLLAAADYAASIGLNVWLGPELWNATPRRTLSTSPYPAASAAFLRWFSHETSEPSSTRCMPAASASTGAPAKDSVVST